MCSFRDMPIFLMLFFIFNFFKKFVSLPSSRQEDRYHSFDCASSNKEEVGKARPPLISLAQRALSRVLEDRKLHSREFQPN